MTLSDGLKAPTFARLDEIRPFAYAPNIDGVLPLVYDDPDAGVLIYALAGRRIVLHDRLSFWASTKRPKAAKEFFLEGVALLQRASQQAEARGVARHGSINPWTLVARCDDAAGDRLAVLGYGLTPFEDSPRSPVPASKSKRAPTKEQRGAVLTQRYLQPEHFGLTEKGTALASELYSLALVAAEIAMGKPVFSDPVVFKKGIEQTMLDVRTEDLQAEMDPALASVLGKQLAANPSHRPTTIRGVKSLDKITGGTFAMWMAAKGHTFNSGPHPLDTRAEDAAARALTLALVQQPGENKVEAPDEPPGEASPVDPVLSDAVPPEPTAAAPVESVPEPQVPELSPEVSGPPLGGDEAASYGPAPAEATVEPATSEETAPKEATLEEAARDEAAPEEAAAEEAAPEEAAAEEAAPDEAAAEAPPEAVPADPAPSEPEPERAPEPDVLLALTVPPDEPPAAPAASTDAEPGEVSPGGGGPEQQPLATALPEVDLHRVRRVRSTPPPPPKPPIEQDASEDVRAATLSLLEYALNPAGSWSAPEGWFTVLGEALVAADPVSAIVAAAPGGGDVSAFDAALLCGCALFAVGAPERVSTLLADPGAGSARPGPWRRAIRLLLQARLHVKRGAWRDARAAFVLAEDAIRTASDFELWDTVLQAYKIELEIVERPSEADRVMSELLGRLGEWTPLHQLWTRLRRAEMRLACGMPVEEHDVHNDDGVYTSGPLVAWAHVLRGVLAAVNGHQRDAERELVVAQHRSPSTGVRRKALVWTLIHMLVTGAKYERVLQELDVIDTIAPRDPVASTVRAMIQRVHPPRAGRDAPEVVLLYRALEAWRARATLSMDMVAAELPQLPLSHDRDASLAIRLVLAVPRPTPVTASNRPQPLAQSTHSLA